MLSSSLRQASSHNKITRQDTDSMRLLADKKWSVLLSDSLDILRQLIMSASDITKMQNLLQNIVMHGYVLVLN
jgi:hypothetical protein